MEISRTIFSVGICFMLGSCGRPDPIDVAATKCEKQADPAECINNHIFGDTAGNAVGGALVGVVAGGIIGYATGGPRRAAIDAAAGAVSGAATAAALTYYSEHREANALADIHAQNRDLNFALGVYDSEIGRLNADLSAAKDEARVQRTLNAELVASLQRQMADRERLGRQIAEVQLKAEDNLNKYKEAVEIKFKSIPPQIQAELGKYNEHVSFMDKSGQLNHEREEQIARFLRDNGILPSAVSRS